MSYPGHSLGVGILLLYLGCTFEDLLLSTGTAVVNGQARSRLNRLDKTNSISLNKVMTWSRQVGRQRYFHWYEDIRLIDWF